MITERLVEYTHDGVVLEGLLASDAAAGRPRPAVLIAHAWGGRGELENGKARALAEAGYAAFAMDLYGKGIRGTGPEQNAGLMRPFLEDRARLQARMLAALEALRALPGVDPSRLAAMGFCFGGLCVLDLARTGADLRGAISIHGLFTPPGNIEAPRIRAKVLVLHGHDDPMAPPGAALDLARELTAAGADWQMHLYGHARHAFTNPQANDPVRGTVYQPDADRRSWQSVLNFLGEVLV